MSKKNGLARAYRNYLLQLRENKDFPYHEKLRKHWFDSNPKCRKFIKACELNNPLVFELSDALPFEDRGPVKGFKTLLVERMQKEPWPPQGHSYHEEATQKGGTVTMAIKPEPEGEEKKAPEEKAVHAPISASEGSEILPEKKESGERASAPQPEAQAPKADGNDELPKRRFGKIGLWHRESKLSYIWSRRRRDDPEEDKFDAEWEDLDDEVRKKIDEELGGINPTVRIVRNMHIIVSFIPEMSSGSHEPNMARDVKLAREFTQQRPKPNYATREYLHARCREIENALKAETARKIDAAIKEAREQSVSAILPMDDVKLAGIDSRISFLEASFRGVKEEFTKTARSVVDLSGNVKSVSDEQKKLSDSHSVQLKKFGERLDKEMGEITLLAERLTATDVKPDAEKKEKTEDKKKSASADDKKMEKKDIIPTPFLVAGLIIILMSLTYILL